MPKGVFIKPRIAWNLLRCAGFGTYQGGTSGAYWKVSLFNDTANAKNLGVYAITLWQGTFPSVGLLKSAYGAVGSLLQKGNPIVAGGPQIAGSIYTLNDVSQPGTTIMEPSGDNNNFQDIRPEPIFIVPPNYSLLFQTSFTGSSITLGLIWGEL